MKAGYPYPAPPMVVLENFRFGYAHERVERSDPSLAFEDRECAAILGPSGCGKTTLLRLIAAILRPAEGRITVLDRDLTAFHETAARAFRIRNIGLVFQEFELLDYLTAADNILLPYRVTTALGPTVTAEIRTRLGCLAERTGITRLLGAYPRQLSQGERQRVAICRALITGPRLLLADEPTGSLDPANQDRIVELLLESASATGAGLLMVTHDHRLLGHFERTVDLQALTRATPAS